MRELLGSTSNSALVPADSGKLVGVAEVILVLSEPTYSIDPSGAMNKSRVVEPIRFSATAKGLRQLVASLTEYADGLDELAASVNPQQ